jgi:hypothetical protein
MQAFKFIMIEDDDHRRLRQLIGAGDTQAPHLAVGTGFPLSPEFQVWN